MTINKVKASEYSILKADSVADYIISYYNSISKLIYNNKHKQLKDCNKTQLNHIAAELETVKKRLEWIIEGQY